MIRLGLLIRLELLSSVAGGKRLIAATTPVEAPDQLRLDRLYGLVALQVVTGQRPGVAVDSDHLLFLVKTPSGELTSGRCMGNGPVSSKQRAFGWLDQRGKRARVLALLPFTSDLYR